MKKKRITGLSVIFMLAICLMPQFELTANASKPSCANMLLGGDVLATDANTDDAQNLVYGNDEWVVVDTETNGSYTMLAKNNQFNGWFYFSKNHSKSQAYAESNLRLCVADVYKKFTSEEKTALNPRTLIGGGGAANSSNFKKDRIYGASVKGEGLWPMTLADAEKVSVDLLCNKAHRWETYTLTGKEYYWWLCTPGDSVEDKDVYFAYAVNNKGEFEQLGTDGVFQVASLRTSFYLNKDAILLTTSKNGGKDSGNVGPDALKAVGTNTGNEWKVTVKDSNRDSFTVTQCANSYNKDTKSVKVLYSNAVTGSGNYISAIITDGDTKEIKYYGRIKELKDATDATGIVTVDLAGKSGDGDYLYLFNEKYNNNSHADLSSSLQHVTIPGTASIHPFEHTIEGSSEGNYKLKSTCPVCGYTEYPSSNITVTHEVTKEVTCEEEGEEIQHVKSVLYDEVKATKDVTVAIPATGHDWSDFEYHYDTDASCYADRYCKTCEKRQVIENDQINTELVEEEAPTCTVDGYKKVRSTFTLDGQEYDSGEQTITLPKTGHTPGELKINNDNGPTCTEPGEVSYWWECAVCGEAIQSGKEEFPALGHDWIVNEDTNKAGWKRVDETTLERTCDRCGKIETRGTIEHTHELELFPAKEPTCIQDGNIECYRCNICLSFFEDEAGTIPLEDDDVIIPKTLHTLGDRVDTIVEPTCTTPGYHYNIHYCTECGEIMTSRLVKDEKLGHKWGTPQYKWDALKTQCTATKKCSRCGEEYTETTVDITSEVSKQPTCEEMGETTYTAVFADEDFGTQTYPNAKNILPLRHDWGAPVYTWNSDNTQVTATRTCKRDGCGKQQSETVDAAREVTQEPSCNSGGIAVYTSSAFTNAAFTVQTKEVELDPLEHEWGEWTDLQEVTADGDAVEVRECILCHATKQRVVPKSIEGCTISGIEDKTYTGEEITQDIVVTKTCTYTDVENTQDVVETIDPDLYTVTYKDNINAGTATVTIEGKDGCAGTVTKTFAIAGKPIKPSVSLSAASYVYDGKQKKPAVTVKDGSKTLVKDTDYTLIYPMAKNAGTYKVIVTLQGNYSGTASKAFKITKAKNKLTVKGKTVKIKYKKLKKKAQTVKRAKAMKVSKKYGKVTYKLTAAKKGSKKIKLSKAKKYFKINSKTDKIKVKKGLKKGTYKVTVKVTAAGGTNYTTVKKSVTFKIKVK
ncbi:MAG: MBG domain-containing protein [Eubacterium sp.]|nr:MBG domain-containing protein [Eubacterium sp.]